MAKPRDTTKQALNKARLALRAVQQGLDYGATAQFVRSALMDAAHTLRNLLSQGK